MRPFILCLLIFLTLAIGGGSLLLFTWLLLFGAPWSSDIMPSGWRETTSALGNPLLKCPMGYYFQLMSKATGPGAKGFEKRDLAMRQLRRAVQLFNQGDFVCAATLAGAAEEILGRIAQKRAGTTALDGHAHFWSQMAGVVGKAPPDKKKVVDAHNRVRNQLKHNDGGDNEWVAADFEHEAQDLIDRAVRNYWLAYDSPPTDRVINNYVQWNWT